jgi:hypothetical protein
MRLMLIITRKSLKNFELNTNFFSSVFQNPLFFAYGYKTISNTTHSNTVMRRLTTGILYEKCVVRRFRRRANVIECTYTNLDTIAYNTPRLYGTAYCS